MIYSLPQALDRTADKFPDHEAIRCNGKGLTYALLQQQANNLAAILQQQGVQRGDRVGIYINKDIESAVSIYGIMKAGAAYVPLDPFAPVERLSYVINDCGIRVIITKQNKLAQVRSMVAETNLNCLIGIGPQDDLVVTCIPWEQVTDPERQDMPNLHVIEQDLAYILYTSGSTGTPKGIMHTHRSALSFAEWACDEYELTVEDRVTNHAPYHFDLSTFDLFATMLAGGTMVIIPEFVTKFPASHSQLLQDEKITVSYTVPFALIMLMERGALAKRDLSALRWVLFAGEVFPTKHLRELMKQWPEKRFSNLYGPTETNVCTYYHVPLLAEDDEDTIPIGFACANEEMLVVDRDNEPVVPGEVGELLVRGGTVMRGYWGRPDLNEKGFYRRSVFGNYEDLFYRTGDLVLQEPDGNFRYFGRKDRQVKTRGYRVELDEVEVALLAHEDVKEAAVYTVSDGNGSNLIEAAVIPNENTELTHNILAKHVGDKLPPYAVPTKIYIMADFPRTSTGKINRRELQVMSEQQEATAVAR
ncbi:MAG: amino acid adenylation domain-containing protein [Ardenticatenaceae bacterium]|nr:amino acid adenylation domain-containing protein [Anaerolineales bacterium]MCB8981758.1 amino acid adenylation domain-containing protein [Ardenticatenaceae bacterium]